MNTNGKKLTRSSTDKRIAGVCGGLGAYLDVDPTVIRIIALILLFCVGGGAILYLILWIAMPWDNETHIVNH